MLKALLLSFTLASRAMAMAQFNLVSNGSFEDTVNCYMPTQTLEKAEHWYNPNLATPDLFDADLDRLCGAPMNPNQSSTFMEPHEGLRLAGGYLWYSTGTTREYLMVELSESLQPETEFEVSLWYARRRTHKYAVDHIGIWVGHDSLFEATTGRLSVVPQVRLRDPYSAYLTNAEAWTQLTDTFTAVGGERWLVIGNFDAQDSVNGVVAEPNAILTSSYYYIDDVVVRAIGGTGISNPALPVAWWNGQGIEFKWSSATGPMATELIDASGRVVYRSQNAANSERTTLPVGQLRSGVYLLRLILMGKVGVVRFVKEDGGF